jgi:chloramphenicol 3-O-phosphotransferase
LARGRWRPLLGAELRDGRLTHFDDSERGTGPAVLILLLNGAFGIGKTAVARALTSRMPRSMLYDPEIAGIALQRAARFILVPVSDFQDLVAWRRLTVTALRLARLRSANIIVPMAFSNADYLAELRAGIGSFEPRLFHFCLVAPTDVIHARLRGRGADPYRHAWQFRRATECCEAHASSTFAQHVSTVDRTPDEIARKLLATVESA